MWLIYALMAPLLWAFVHVLDEHCVDHLFEKPWMGVVTSSVASITIFLFLPLVLPYIDWQTLHYEYLLLGLLVGLLIQLSQAFYFHALSFSEAGIVAAYWNIIPAVLPIVSFFIFGSVLQTNQYLGIILLIFASTTMCLLDYHFTTRQRTLILMSFSCVFQILAYLIMNHIYHRMDFFITFYSIITGIIFFGSVPLLKKSVRDIFRKNLPTIRQSVRLFILIEALNILALCSAQFGIKLANSSLVAAAETTVPAFTFIFSIFWLRHMKGSTIALWSNFGGKMITIVLMVIGVMLIQEF